MCTPQLMQMMQQYQQNGGAQMQLGPVGGAASAGPMQSQPTPQQAQPAAAQQPNNTPIPPQVIAALAARHAAQAHAVPAGLVNHVASSHVGSH